MRSGESNAIVVHITITTHDDIDVVDGVRKLINAPDTFFEKWPEVRNRSDFIDKFRHLSTVVVRSIWTSQGRPRNEIVQNGGTECSFPESLSNYLRTADI